MPSHSGDLLLWVGVHRQSCINIFLRTIGPRGGNYVVKSVKLMYFLENLLLYFGAWFRQLLSVYRSNDDQESFYQNCKFHDSQGRGS